METVFDRTPATKYQAMALLLWLLARHAKVDPPLTQMSRALRRADSFAHGVLEQLLERRTRYRKHAARDGIDFRSVLRWFAPGGDARAYAARARLDELMSSADAYVQGFEGFVCWHVCMSSLSREEQLEMTHGVLNRIAAGTADPGRERWLKSLVQHAMLDCALNLREEFEEPAVLARYEPVDHLFQIATGLAATGAPPEALASAIAAMRARSVEQFVLAAQLLVVRMGALPGFALIGRGYLHMLEQMHGDVLRHAPSLTCAEYAAQFDYGADFAAVLRTRDEGEVDLVPLFERALCLVGRGATRRRRGTSDGGWRKDDVRRISRLFSTWGFAHECCWLFGPAFDVHNESSAIAKEVAALARLFSDTSLNKMLGELILTELFPGPFDRVTPTEGPPAAPRAA
ncbi:hypothetical protein [Polyangium aurulentum]|uniref:hypothetical protein n=1 Tax=Polyangium aurulentum TaxID=2567896 RepID=UPI0010AEBD2A|nr:hypothetical protein [Polyangium aurulentum]UQA57088.1 hypothetical protein E8A73_038230 [Polyangium aurulentum]